jgi:hypothetical protein
LPRPGHHAATGGLENRRHGCDDFGMSDALDMILADPQLREWPHRGPSPLSESDATEFPPAPRGAPRTDNTTAPAAPPPAPPPETPPAAVIAPPAHPNPTAAAPESVLLTGTAVVAAPPRGAPTAQDRDDTYDPPRDNSAADAVENTDNVDDVAASNSGSAPPAFDEITRPRRHLRDTFTRPTEWVKENWRRPQVLGSAAAAVVAAVTVTVWAAASSEPAPQPTATLTAPSAAAAAPPASTPIVDGPIPVKSASARCPAPSSDPMGAVRPDSTQPWICVRAWGIDGQVLTLTLDGPYVITAVRIMPGVNAESDGQDQWLRYRTLTRVAWSFNDADRTKIVQSTDNRRELLTETVAPADCASAGCSVVASQVALTVEKTTAPAAAPTATGLGISPAGGGIGTDGATAFGVSRIEIIGHRAG